MLAELHGSFATIHKAYGAAAAMTKLALHRLKALKDEDTRRRLIAALSE
jgi:hypothetical protein